MSAYKAVSVLLAFLSFGLAAPARAGTITLYEPNIGGNFIDQAPGGGGPYWAVTNDSAFMTFCLEHNEVFYYGQPYEYTLNDDLTDATKWLYAEVRSDLYKNVDIFGSGPGVGARVQEAIWFLQGGLPGNEIAKESKDLADFALTQNWSELYDAGYRVQRVHMAGDGEQDQLYYDHDPSAVPEPASMILLGTGILAVFRARKA